MQLSFHIDFGGSSVFYHLLSGEKVFYFIEPTKANLKKYEKWSSSPEQSVTFLGDEIKGGPVKVHLQAGNTMIIPTGWIHAVYTPKDSIVIGGNFLQGLNISGQLDIYDIEKRTNVPAKFRFPYFEKMQWYAARKYLKDLEDGVKLSPFELDGLERLHSFLVDMLSRMKDTATERSERTHLKKSVPDGMKYVGKMLKALHEAVTRAKKPPAIIRLKVTASGGQSPVMDAGNGGAAKHSPPSTENGAFEAVAPTTEEHDSQPNQLALDQSPTSMKVDPTSDLGDAGADGGGGSEAGDSTDTDSELGYLDPKDGDFEVPEGGEEDDLYADDGGVNPRKRKGREDREQERLDGNKTRKISGHTESAVVPKARIKKPTSVYERLNKVMGKMKRRV
ncbi:Lysine-specific demethylase 7A [Rhizophlyctis rosea]|nr:Lysine-specific demethylase 7A [Rhizophlyctis rosea]